MQTELALGDEASSVPPRAPREVIERQKIWEGGTVELTVPGNAKYHEAEIAGQNLRYLRFAHFLKPGAMNIFVHAENPKGYLGKKVVATMELWSKILEGGQVYYYIDLRPLTGHAAPTHKLTVVQGPCPERYKTPHFTVFETPAPCVGAVVLSPLKAPQA